MKLFLDSGAFSAWNSGKQIRVDDYTDFVLENQDIFDIVASLDVIPGTKDKPLSIDEANASATAGWRNYGRMLRRGCDQSKLMPTFHNGDDFRWLEKMVSADLPYIGLATKIDKTTTQKREWLDSCMPFLSDCKSRLHGFAVTQLELVIEYPWYSIDGTWFYNAARFGTIDVPSKFSGDEKLEDFKTNIVFVGHGKSQNRREDKGGFGLVTKKASQYEISFGQNPLYLKRCREFLSEHGFDFDEICSGIFDKPELSAAWSVYYFDFVTSKFSKSKPHAFLSGNLSMIEKIMDVFQAKNIKIELNILVSYPMTKKTIKKVIELKNKWR